jgi:myo-inositol-1(or 4)-monophosphatase
VPEHDSELALIVEAVRATGALIMPHFGQVKSWEKEKGSPVSEADIAADRLLHERLIGARPGYGWLSEETVDDWHRLERRRVFVVDPIDGTRAFMKGVTEFSISVALVEDGAPIAAAVYNPATEELFEATAGGGARRNGERLQVRDGADFAGTRFLAGKRSFQEALGSDAEHSAAIWVGSVAYRLGLVAAGAFDGTLSLYGTHDWDIAAGALIVTEAGGRITLSSGAPIRFNQSNTRHASMVAAGPQRHAKLIERIRAAAPLVDPQS